MGLKIEQKAADHPKYQMRLVIKLRKNYKKAIMAGPQSK